MGIVMNTLGRLIGRKPKQPQTSRQQAATQQKPRLQQEPLSEWTDATVLSYDSKKHEANLSNPTVAPDIFVRRKNIQRSKVGFLKPGDRLQIRWRGKPKHGTRLEATELRRPA